MIVYGSHLGALGQDDLSAYTDESTLTGLPVYAEIALGIVALFALSKLVGAGKSVTKSVRKRSRTKARRAALQAQLAGL